MKSNLPELHTTPTYFPIAEQFDKFARLAFTAPVPFMNLPKAERERLQIAYVMGAQLAKMVIEGAVHCPNENFAKKIMDEFTADLAAELEKLSQLVAKP